MPDASLKPAPAAKTHRLDYAPPLTVRERLARHLPTSDGFVDFLKTLIWVAPLTLLIWVYAEREQNVTQAGIIVPIEVRTSDPSRIVTLRGPADKNIVLELSGPRAKLDHIRDLLKPNPKGGAPLVIDIDPQIGAGENKPLTISQINDNAIFKSNGITVKSAQPPYLVVDIDTYEEREIPVAAPPEVAGLLSDQTRFSPDTVKVRAPKALFESQPKQPVFVYADLAKREELKTTTGQLKLESVPVYWGSGSGRENVHLSPATVTANLDIKQRDIEYTIPSVAITKETPLGFEENSTVKYEQTISNVVVTGPREQIELLKKDFKVKAVLEITNFDKGVKNLKRPLQFKLPPGVSLTTDSLKRANWEFSVENNR